MNRKHLPQKGFFHELQEFVDTFFSNPFADFFDLNMVQFNLFETEEAYIVKAELPGYHPKNIQLEVTGPYLRVRASKTVLHEVQNDHDQTYVTEQSQEMIERMIDFPFSLEHKPITARYQNNVLEVTIKKDGFISEKITTIPVQSFIE
ncbi:Hsp20/alpha crystallin family protein [Bacillus songklensis]|uniref:Hsp20/alpha crystallin family protein n=1 Tax=Bacillus songklensis TaxID=1069116 RepID=A0ABV8B8I5_9BACI